MALDRIYFDSDKVRCGGVSNDVARDGGVLSGAVSSGVSSGHDNGYDCCQNSLICVIVVSNPRCV